MTNVLVCFVHPPSKPLGFKTQIMEGCACPCLRRRGSEASVKLTVQESWAQMTISTSLSAEKPSLVPDPLGWPWRQGPGLDWPGPLGPQDPLVLTAQSPLAAADCWLLPPSQAWL